MIKRRVEGNERPFVSCNGAQHLLLVHTLGESLLELHLIIRIAADFFDDVAKAGRAHLEGVRDWQRCLLLERVNPAVPELCLIVKSVQESWRVTLPHASMDTNRNRPAVGEGALRIMARRAGDCAVARESAIEKQLFAVQSREIMAAW